jgi:hypothetical protein
MSGTKLMTGEALSDDIFQTFNSALNKAANS